MNRASPAASRVLPASAEGDETCPVAIDIHGSGILKSVNNGFCEFGSILAAPDEFNLSVSQ
jgi:hypothetical protein